VMSTTVKGPDGRREHSKHTALQASVWVQWSYNTPVTVQEATRELGRRTHATMSEQSNGQPNEHVRRPRSSSAPRARRVVSGPQAFGLKSLFLASGAHPDLRVYGPPLQAFAAVMTYQALGPWSA